MPDHETEIPIGQHGRAFMVFEIKEKSESYPHRFRFAIVGQIAIARKWKDIIRIDNSPHEGKLGTHIHYFDREKREGKFPVEYKIFKNQRVALLFVQNYITSRYGGLLYDN